MFFQLRIKPNEWESCNEDPISEQAEEEYNEDDLIDERYLDPNAPQ